MPLGPVASASTTVPTGWIRCSTRLSFCESPFSPLVTSCETMTASVIGTANASSTTMTSCFGVLIGEECSSVMGGKGVAWEYSGPGGAERAQWRGPPRGLTRNYTAPAPGADPALDAGRP